MIHLRPAHKDDCKLLWEWVNDPDVRQSAFSSDPIAWDEHVQWFAKKLGDLRCFQFIALDDQNAPVGQIRFDMQSDRSFEVDVSLDKIKRRLGYGSLLIATGIDELTRLAQVEYVHAFVKIENKASTRAFEKAGFMRQGIEIVKGCMSAHLIWSSNE